MIKKNSLMKAGQSFLGTHAHSHKQISVPPAPRKRSAHQPPKRETKRRRKEDKAEEFLKYTLSVPSVQYDLQTYNPLVVLPDDMWKDIFSCLSLPDLFAFKSTSTQMTANALLELAVLQQLSTRCNVCEVSLLRRSLTECGRKGLMIVICPLTGQVQRCMKCITKRPVRQKLEDRFDELEDDKIILRCLCCKAETKKWLLPNSLSSEGGALTNFKKFCEY